MPKWPSFLWKNGAYKPSIALHSRSGGKLRKGASRLFYDLSPDHTHVAVVGLGPSAADISAKEGDAEGIDIAAQNVREAAAIGTRVLQGAKVKSVLLDDFNNAEGK